MKKKSYKKWIELDVKDYLKQKKERKKRKKPQELCIKICINKKKNKTNKKSKQTKEFKERQICAMYLEELESD